MIRIPIPITKFQTYNKKTEPIENFELTFTEANIAADM